MNTNINSIVNDVLEFMRKEILPSIIYTYNLSLLPTFYSAHNVGAVQLYDLTAADRFVCDVYGYELGNENGSLLPLTKIPVHLGVQT